MKQVGQALLVGMLLGALRLQQCPTKALELEISRPCFPALLCARLAGLALEQAACNIVLQACACGIAGVSRSTALKTAFWDLWKGTTQSRVRAYS